MYLIDPYNSTVTLCRHTAHASASREDARSGGIDDIVFMLHRIAFTREILQIETTPNIKNVITNGSDDCPFVSSPHSS